MFNTLFCHHDPSDHRLQDDDIFDMDKPLYPQSGPSNISLTDVVQDAFTDIITPTYRHLMVCV